MKIVAFFFFLIFYSTSNYGQCCSAGNPVGGTTNLGILDSGTVRAISFYRHSTSEGYWDGASKSDFDFVSKANFNVAGLTLIYGISDDMNLEAEFGYYFNKSQTYNVTPEFTNKGHGLSNAVISLKQNVVSKTKKSFEWTLGLGLKFPFSKKYQVVDNVELPRDVQPSTTSYGLVLQSFFHKPLPKKDIKLFLISRFESNTPDVKNFRYGNALINSFFITKQIKKSNWTAILQARHEFRSKDVRTVIQTEYLGLVTNGVVVDYSGGNLIFLSPQVNYTIAKKWNISLVGDIPLYRNYNGIQLGNKYSLAVYLSRDFGSSNSCEVEEENL